MGILAQKEDIISEESGVGAGAAENRNRTIVRTSIIGIAANVALAAFKAVIGLLSHSIAIVMDAVNNISDAASSIITIVGTKLAGKAPDRKHPFGHGRVEYLSAMVISILVLYAGITALVESVKKIITPEVPEYGPAAFIIIAVAVVVKIVLGRFVKKTGERVNSDSLIASGTDATLDSAISASTLVAAVIFVLTGVSLEAWLGAIIAVIIIKSGIEMLKDTLSQILGERAEAELSRGIHAAVRSVPGVLGSYDLVLNNYGPDKYNGSIHVEVPDTLSADDIDRLAREIQVKVHKEQGVVLTAVGIYSKNTKDDENTEIENRLREVALSEEYVLQIHGVYITKDPATLRFDAVISFDSPNRIQTYQNVVKKVSDAFPGYTIICAMDTAFSEL